ncbi:MAG: hypothetical protein BJ554DRAFT_1913, partial [Olpidium bornovanus]
WNLRSLKLFLVSKHGAAPVNNVFTEIEALVVRSLMSVQRVMINDKHCFELYGYDVLIDRTLKPCENQADYDLKYGVLKDCFECVDVERRLLPDKKVRSRVGGFDLVYNDGPVVHERASDYS